MAKEKNPLDGIVRFMTDDGWSEEMRLRLEAHLQPTCEAMGIAMEQLPSLLEGDVYAMLVTCVVEDLMTRTAADGRNLTEAYLKRHGWKQSGIVRRQLQALRQSKAGLYEVTDTNPGEGLTLRNLLAPKETLDVVAGQLSTVLPVGVPVGARVLRVDGEAILGGGVLPFEDHMTAEAVAAVGADDTDLPARISNFWLRKTIEEKRGTATAEAPDEVSEY